MAVAEIIMAVAAETIITDVAAANLLSGIPSPVNDRRFCGGPPWKSSFLKGAFLFLASVCFPAPECA